MTKLASLKQSKANSALKSIPITPGKSGCSHTRDALKSKRSVILRSYELAIRAALSCGGGSIDSDNFIPPRKKSRIEFYPKCFTCKKTDNFLCLECSHIGCINHIRDERFHKPLHKLGVDLSTRDGYLFCFACFDYVYDDDFENVRVKKINKVFGSLSETSSVILGELNSVVDEEEEADDRRNGNSNGNGNDVQNEKPPPTQSVTPSYQATTGLKGFYNMGATCFMSVILQSLIHNPLVRNFFLARGHDSDECEQPNCLACCVDKVFIDFFANNTIQGFGMTNILTASFNLKKSLAGASEQDAHEFLQFILDEFHKTHFQGRVFEQVTKKYQQASPPPTPFNDDTCDCISHRTFYGQLESRIKCQTCGNITATIDPMMDLSLEIKALPKKSKKTITLNDCLDRFTGSEKLDSTYYCSRCDTRRIVDKQLFVKRLPTVLSIQLKRFEHSRMSAKIETRVEFPLFLDMHKYTSSEDKDITLSYELFGVVCHQGSINTGHYTCMMKNRYGSWFHFDDAMVTKVNTSHVLSSNAYLLFYIVSECAT